MNRRGFLRTGSCAAALAFSPAYWCTAGQKGPAPPTKEEILSRAATQVEKERKGDCLVAVRDANGRPVPGIKVKIEQLRHDFLFGCNLFMFGRCGDPEVEEKYRRQFSGLLNYCTLGFYWANYEAQRRHPNYEYTDSVVEWTRANGVKAKGHPLVWDHPAGSPRWLPDDNETIAQLSNERVRAIVSRFQDRIDVWDVVNEATHLPDKVNKTKMAAMGLWKGSVRYTGDPLKVARAANPKAVLVVNDYRSDQAYYDLLRNLAEDGRHLFDVVGIQSHMHDGVWPLHKVWDVCDRFSKLGQPLHFTETTIVSGPRIGSAWGDTTPEGEDQQAEQVIEFYRVLFGHPAVQGITWWDFSDLHAWQGAAAGWLRKDMSPKPVYERLVSLIKGQWWTWLEGETGQQGNLSARVFYGTYRITVSPPNGPPLNREVHWQRGQPNELIVHLK